EVVAEIRSSLRGRSPSARSAGGAKHIAEAKQVAQDVFYAAEAGRAPRGIGSAARHCRVPETIVTLSLFGIRKNRIRFGGFLELLFRFGIALVLVGMILMREPSIDRKSTRLNSSHSQISYAVFCLKKKKNTNLLKQL